MNVGRILLGGVAAAVVAAVLNLIVWFLARVILGDTLAAGMGGPETIVPLAAMSVVFASVVPALLAAALLGLLAHYMRKPLLIFWAISAIVFVLSLFAPLSLPVATAAKVALIVMHVVAAGSIVFVLTKVTAPKQHLPPSLPPAPQP